MRERSGFDVLGIVMLALGAVCIIIRHVITVFAGIALIVLAVLRAFSRNTAARYEEDQAFIRLFRGIRPAWRRFIRWIRITCNRVRVWFVSRGSRKQSDPGTREANTEPKLAYFTCPQCAQKMRAPQGLGTIRVRCSRCGSSFQVRT